MSEIISDAASFTRHILKNKFLTGDQVQDVIDVLDAQLKARIQAANADSLGGSARDAYMFFQGGVMGMLIAFKQVKMHYENTAWEQGRNPATGATIEDHGNA